MNNNIDRPLRSIEDILNEGRNAEKAYAKALQLIRAYFNDADWLDTEFVHNDNPNHLSYLDYMEHHCREDFGFHANIPDAVVRLYPIIAKIAFENGYQQENPDARKLNRLGKFVNYIKENYKAEGFPIPLNKLTLDNTSYDSLDRMFGSIIDERNKADNDAANSFKNAEPNRNYDIILCKTYEMAHSYGNHSCSLGRLCYTQGKSTWESYTQDGENTVYIVLRKDWEEIPEEHGPNTPYDDYGLSMIFLFINPEGELVYSNTRWNHENEGRGPSDVDQSFTKSQIAKLLNVNFDETFKHVVQRRGYDCRTLIDKINSGKINPQDNLSDFVDSIICIRPQQCYVFKVVAGDWFVIAQKQDGMWRDVGYNNNFGFDNVIYNLEQTTDRYFICVGNSGSETLVPVDEIISDSSKSVLSYTIYRKIWPCRNGAFRVMYDEDNFSFVCERDGRIITGRDEYGYSGTLWFKSAKDFSESGFAEVVRKDDTKMFVNLQGAQFTEEEYKELTAAHEKLSREPDATPVGLFDIVLEIYDPKTGSPTCWFAYEGDNTLIVFKDPVTGKYTNEITRWMPGMKPPKEEEITKDEDGNEWYQGARVYRKQQVSKNESLIHRSSMNIREQDLHRLVRSIIGGMMK